MFEVHIDVKVEDIDMFIDLQTLKLSPGGECLTSRRHKNYLDLTWQFLKKHVGFR